MSLNVIAIVLSAVTLGLVTYLLLKLRAVSYTHLTLPTNTTV